MALLRSVIVLAAIAFVITGEIMSFVASLLFAPILLLPVLPFLMLLTYWLLPTVSIHAQRYHPHPEDSAV